MNAHGHEREREDFKRIGCNRTEEKNNKMQKKEKEKTLHGGATRSFVRDSECGRRSAAARVSGLSERISIVSSTLGNRELWQNYHRFVGELSWSAGS